LKANKVNLFVSFVLFVFWYHSLNFLDTPRITHIASLLYWDHVIGTCTSQNLLLPSLCAVQCVNYSCLIQI
jgi:hypothetical protein